MTENNSPIECAVEKARQRGLVNFTLGYFDQNGRLRAKYCNTATLEKVLREGTALSMVALSSAPDETPMQNSPFLDPANQFPDAELKVSAESCRDFPLDGEGMGQIFIGELMNDFAGYCPRALLGNELERYANLGISPYGAFEIEWYMLEEDRSSIIKKSAKDLQVRNGFEWFYSFVDHVKDNALYRDIMDTFDAMDIPVETMHSEHSQLVEAALHPVQGIRIADNAGLFKWVMKAIAARHGLMASFMARRSTDSQGCGAHLNLSMLDSKGTSVFYDQSGENKMSETMRHFLGGVLRYTPELFLLHAPNLNSYRRFKPGLFTPLSNTWGVNNKTVAFRVVTTSAGSARIESRIPGADISPHLGLLATLIAGRKGIEESIDPGDPVKGDGWTADDWNRLGFPLDFALAIGKFEHSPLARQVLGDKFVDFYVASRKWQLEDLANTITDWEVRTFIEGV